MDVLKSLGATVITVNIPAFDIYSNTIGASRGATVTSPNAVELANLHAIDPNLNAFPFPYPTTTTGGVSGTWSSQVAAYYYEKQIEGYNNPQLKNLDDLYNALHNSPSRTTIPGAANNIKALADIYDAGQAAGFGFHTDTTTGKLVADNPGEQALQGIRGSPQPVLRGLHEGPHESEVGCRRRHGPRHHTHRCLHPADPQLAPLLPELYRHHRPGRVEIRQRHPAGPVREQRPGCALDRRADGLCPRRYPR